MITLRSYDVCDWYWKVESFGRVFSTKSMSYLSQGDQTYLAWVEDGGHATVIPEANDLLEVLHNQWMPRYLAAGVRVESESNPALNRTYSLDAAAQQRLDGLVAGLHARHLLGSRGNPVTYQGCTIEPDQFATLAYALHDWIDNVECSVKQIVTTGSGSMPHQPIPIP